MTAILERRKRRLRLQRAARRGVSYGLEEWLEGDEPTTLGTLSDAFGEKILAVACLTMMAPSALPIPTGGATHVFDVFAVVFAAQMVLARRTIWMPASWRSRELGAKSCKALGYLVRFTRWCERFSRRRLGHLMAGRTGEVVLGAIITVFVVGAFLSPPLSGLDTLPALGVVLIALGILMEDVVFAIVGTVVGTAGLLLTAFFGVQATHFIAGLF